ncbi:hypothetical protein BJ138DRAFT_1106125 [Hygrophoropsis aurantiaca]|uniref:Uncharacterized protein n=1 Tax=Hygrophoropsis aurantiaca TaxID=72124 RepID=A0ACB7ZX35_9AGAM|nr:hypothetical protein BJ138DRAFT_1106125 [Hygrophoropsis aurantiaca]
MADPAFIQGLQAEQTINYVSVLTFSQEASTPDNRNIHKILIILSQVDHIWQLTMKTNMEESTVELYDRFIPYCPFLWASKHDCTYVSIGLIRKNGGNDIEHNIFHAGDNIDHYFLIIP